MSHDIEASWAGAEVARLLASDPSLCFDAPPSSTDVSTYAGREGKTRWPHADGVIEFSDSASGNSYNIALEYKRPNEGLHGILTAIGQSHAYLRKGYSGSVIVLPKSYSGVSNVGAYTKDVLDNASGSTSIGLFVYDEPDRSKVSPFENVLTTERKFKLDGPAPASPVSGTLGKPETQWMHLREGSSDPDAFFRYLQAVKLVSGEDDIVPVFSPPSKLLLAVNRISGGADPIKYLSYSSGNTTHDQAWRYFWFKNVLFTQMMLGWTRTSSGAYKVNHVESKIKKSDGSGYKKFFSGRADSNKTKIVEKLNAGTVSEGDAWDFLAENFHKRAHSYREDLDSGLENIGFIDNDGRLTAEGYKFLDECEKSLDANSGLPKALLGNAILDTGGLSGFLHYIYKLSDEKFTSNPLEFTTQKPDGSFSFDRHSYLSWLESELSDRLRVLRKVSARGGVSRKPFQAEFAVLRGFGFVFPGFRLGVGLPINWPEINRILDLNV